MLVYITVLFPIRNRLSALLIKVKACENIVRRPEGTFLLGYQILYTCQSPDVSPQFLMQIGLDKLRERAKGINHPKHAVEAACACLKRESATS